jgi:hypothetical protein
MLLLSIVGSLCIFLSNISIIILFTIAIVIIRDGITQNKTNLKRLVLPLTTWALSFGYYYYMFINNHPNKKSMLNYWGESFMPINVFKISFWDFCFYKTKMIFFSLLSFDSAGIIALVFFTIGLYNLIKAKNKNILFLFLLPILLQLILSIFKLYPFDLRLILYQTGFYILILSVGIIDITTWGFQKIKKGWIAWIPIIFPLMVCINLFKNYPIKVEELKNSVEFISNHIQPNETIYIYYGAIPAYKYYTETKKISFKNPILFGKVSREDEIKYIKEIENNKNKCWIIFSHIYDTENKYITNYFDVTYKKIFSYTTIGSEVYLYDMTEIKKNY